MLRKLFLIGILVLNLAPVLSTGVPTSQPSNQPSNQPTVHPSICPTSQPFTHPTGQPSHQPSNQPSCQPQSFPSSHPTSQPFMKPSAQPSTQPSSRPSSQPLMRPSSQPSQQPVTRPSTQPTSQPSTQPTCQPNMHPSRQPSNQPTTQPSLQPNSRPSAQPSSQPVAVPSCQPSSQPSTQPSQQPIKCPSSRPSTQPSSQPSAQPVGRPTSQPSSQPNMRPSMQPSSQPSLQPSAQPNSRPSGQPSCQPNMRPSSQPSVQPSSQPSQQPQMHPSVIPSIQPTMQPSGQPASRPSSQPSQQPNMHPSVNPSSQPSMQPSLQPNSRPTSQPSQQPYMRPSSQPSVQPSSQPSQQPQMHPSVNPSNQPSMQPSAQPFSVPSSQPSSQPVMHPSVRPSIQPSMQPSAQPVMRPSSQPSAQPIMRPSSQPSVQPSMVPSAQPNMRPSSQPSAQPVMRPSCQPTVQPSSRPSAQPVMRPSAQPSQQPSMHPSAQPVSCPSSQPSAQPVMRPSSQPSVQPSMVPSAQPIMRPSSQPSAQPNMRPSSQPSTQPSMVPSAQPVMRPSSQPSAQPVMRPSCQPTVQPSSRPSAQPVMRPSSQPSSQPNMVPSAQPVSHPSSQPSAQPVMRPSTQPSSQPSMVPSSQPVARPSSQPSAQPVMRPSSQPTVQPSMVPSAQPVGVPSCQPSLQPFSRPSTQPSQQPSSQPSSQPIMHPTSQPSIQPSSRPSLQPSAQPSMQPSRQPVGVPTCQPSVQPSSHPSGQPSRRPSTQPSAQPSSRPSLQPSSQPSTQPSAQPIKDPTSQPSSQPSSLPSQQPTSQPSARPSTQPSACPTVQPSSQPSTVPSLQPTSQPTMSPSSQPSSRPSGQPSNQPSSVPSSQPSEQPSSSPSRQPSAVPSLQPSVQPSARPSRQPSAVPSSQPSDQPSGIPSRQPSSQPSGLPSSQPTMSPSSQPSGQPSADPSSQPSVQPSAVPSMQPSSSPTNQPSGSPSMQPSSQPSSQPSIAPTSQPSARPSSQPSEQPSAVPSSQPSGKPSCQPSSQPTIQPSVRPSAQPSQQPSSQPSTLPSSQPSRQPSAQPSSQPVVRPSSQPSDQPSGRPSTQPSVQPSCQPSCQPSSRPSTQPSAQPTACPSSQPSIQPSHKPSGQPSALPSTQPSSPPSSQPSCQPTDRPTTQPSSQPSALPSSQPSSQPTVEPSSQPSNQPSQQPSSFPSVQPSAQPTCSPSVQPSSQPTGDPSGQPSVQPTGVPSSQPSARPSCQPSGIPSIQPTNQPSARPSTQPSSQPSSDPSSQPSDAPSSQPSVVPSSRPSQQPSAQPSSYPTPIPSQWSNVSEWVVRLEDKLSNTTISLDAGYDQLQYYELKYNFAPYIGGCSSWNNFLGSSPVRKAVTIQEVLAINITTVKLLYDHYALLDRVSETAHCSTPAAAALLVDRLAGVTSGQLNVSCQGHMWRVKNCYVNSPSICVDCEDPCEVHCSNIRTLHFLSSCLPNNGRCPDQFGRRDGLRDSINMVSVFVREKFLVPEFVSIVATSAQNSVALDIALSFSGGVQCGVFSDSVAPPTSLDAVRFQSHVVFSNTSDATNRVSLNMDGLAASTNYTAFCFTMSTTGSQMAFADMLSSGVRTFRTACCKEVRVTVTDKYVTSDQDSVNLLTVTLSAAPSDSLMITINAAQGGVSHNMFFPSSLTFSSSSTGLTASLSFVTSSSYSGAYSVQIALTGVSSAEYSVVFVNSQSSLIVSSSSVEPPTPQLLSAQYTAAGDAIALTFDSPTDRGNGSTSVTCDRLLSFALNGESTCVWVDSSTLLVRPPSAAVLTYEGLTDYNVLSDLSSLDVGATIALRTNTIKAQCRSTVTTACSQWQYSSSSAVISAPNTLLKPVFSLSLPQFMGHCDNVTVDISSSSGGGGRLWRDLTITVQSRQASTRSIARINAFFRDEYVLSPPSAVPGALFELPTEYTFIVSGCSFLGQCGAASGVISVLNSTTPSVTIVGSSYRTIHRGDTLSLSGSAHVVRTCSSESTRRALQYSWTVRRNNRVMGALHSYSNNPMAFKLRPLSLQAGSVYYVYFTALDALSGVSASSFVRVYVAPGDLVARIGGGAAALTLNARESLALDAGRDSFYRDTGVSLNETIGAYTYQWSCLSTAPTFSTNCSQYFENFSLTSPRVILTALSVPSSAIVSVTVTDSTGRSDSTSITLSVVTRAIPLFTVTVRAGGNTARLNVDSKLKLLASLNFNNASGMTLLPSSLTASWTCSDPAVSLLESGLTARSLLMDAYLQTSTRSVPFNLVLAPNTLSAGSRYVFTVRLLQYVASLEVATNSPPAGGSFSVFPSTGVELETLFLFVAAAWEDADLPLTFEFGYSSASGGFLVTSARSERQFDTSYLPRIFKDSASTPQNVTVRVFDSYDAVSTAMTTVRVSANSLALMATVESLLSAEQSSYNALQQVIAVTGGVLNAVDCSAASNCGARYNRLSCANTANTCGACLSADFVGAEGDSNSLCVEVSSLSSSSLSSRRMTSSANIDPYRRLLSDDSVTANSRYCESDTDCSRLLETCSGNLCSAANKTCTNDCSGRGSCRYFNENTGVKEVVCTVADLYCEARCVCPPQFYGAACEFSQSEFSTRIATRLVLFQALANLTQSQDFDKSTVSSWIGTLNALSQAPHELANSHIASELYAKVNLILYGAAYVGSIPSEMLQEVMHSVNFLSIAYSAHGTVPALNSSMALQIVLVSAPDPLATQGLTDLMKTLATLLGADMLVGQQPLRIVQSDTRMAVSAIELKSNAVSSTELLLPQTNLEVHSAVKPSSFSLPPVLADQTSIAILTAFSTASRTVKFGRVLKTNPAYLHIAVGDSFARLNCSNSTLGGCEVRVVLQYNQHVELIPPYENVSHTQCYDRDYYSQNYTCLTAPGTNHTVHCPGVWGVAVERCPIYNTTTMCDSVVSGVASNTSSCRVEHFDDHNVTCLCRLDVDSAWGESFPSSRRLDSSSSAFNASRFSSLSMGYVGAEKVFEYPYNATYDLNHTSSDWVTSRLVLYSMGFYLVAVLLLSCLTLKGSKRKVVAKKTQGAVDEQVISAASKKNKNARTQRIATGEESKSPPESEEVEVIHDAVLDISGRHMEGDDRVFAFDQDTGQTLSSSECNKPHKAMNFKEISSAAFEEALPRVFREGRGALSKLWSEMKLHNRWLTIFYLQSPHYSILMRVMAQALQVLSAIFIQALIFAFYLNPDDGFCGRITNQRACLYHSSSYFPGDSFSKCTWATTDHTCHFRQPQQDWFTVAIVVFISAVVGAPLARLAEWQLVRLSAAVEDPSNLKKGMKNGPNSFSLSSLIPFRGQRRRSRVQPMGAEDPHSPPFLFTAASYSQGEDLFAPVAALTEEETNRFKCEDQIKSLALETELEQLLNRVADHAEAIAEDGQVEEAHELLKIWGMNNEGNLIRSTQLTTETRRWFQAEDRLDVLLCRSAEWSRDVACAELEVLQYSKTTGDEERVRRLHYLFMSDLLASPLSSALLDRKSVRDAFYIGEEICPSYSQMYCGRRPEPPVRHLLIFNLLLMTLVMLAMILFYGLYQAEQLQKAWVYALVLWLALDLILVSPIETAISQFLMPSMIFEQLRIVREEVASSIAHYKQVLSAEYNQRKTSRRRSSVVRKQQLQQVAQLSTQNQASFKQLQRRIKASAHSPSVEHVEAATGSDDASGSTAGYFSAAMRVARLFPELPDAKFISAHHNVNPPGHRFPPSWWRPLQLSLGDIRHTDEHGSREDVVGPDHKPRELKSIASFGLVGFLCVSFLSFVLDMSVIGQELFIQVAVLIALGVLFVVHWYLYLFMPFAVFAPLALTIALYGIARFVYPPVAHVVKIASSSYSAFAARRVERRRLVSSPAASPSINVVVSQDIEEGNAADGVEVTLSETRPEEKEEKEEDDMRVEEVDEEVSDSSSSDDDSQETKSDDDDGEQKANEATKATADNAAILATPSTDSKLDSGPEVSSSSGRHRPPLDTVTASEGAADNPTSASAPLLSDIVMSDVVEEEELL